MKPPPSAVVRTVTLRKDTVVKTQSPMASRRERLRTLAGQEVSRKTGLFVVPQILSFDDARGEIVFERLHLTALLHPAADHRQHEELVASAARALAAIHAQLRPCNETASTTGDGETPIAPRDRGLLHGDFGLRNVLYLPASDRIAVIDWANAQWTGIDEDCGPLEIDMAVFLTSLFHRRAFGAYSTIRRHDLADHFLATYRALSPSGIDLDRLRAVMQITTPRFTDFTRRSKGTLRALGYRHSMIDLNRFLRSLTEQDCASRSSA